MAAPFVVGIDLGTTNSCLAWTMGGAPIAIFPVDQLTPDGRAERDVLPSVLYAPIAEERAGDLEARWATPYCDPPWVTGEIARVRGQEVAARSVTSAKSWLSHGGIDPNEAILPLGAAAGSPRLSPIDASARILVHLARAFETKTRKRLEDASVVLTLPASFDEGARAATLEAARRAGLRPALLEEPQAAFYDVMANPGALDALLGKKKSALVLVVDVGGGTTDLSLVAVERRGGAIACTRVATGDHLLLGGDNMDLALAAFVRARMDDPELDAFRMGQLVRQCRAAKEVLLGDAPPPSYPITIIARGARMVGAAWTTRLTAAEVRRVVVDGFFPEVERGKLPPFRRAALVAAGLPYARDPAITRHVARFLERYGDGKPPTALLLNGGVFRARALRVALAASLRARTGAKIAVLRERDPDLAVARGAAHYALARITGGLRIEAGAPRSYYVGVGSEREPRAVCVVPRGTLEGVRSVVRTPTLRLRTGELARFDLFRARTGVIHSVGEIVDASEKSFARLRPLVARAFGGAGQVDVVLSGELTPVGTLDLSLREIEGKRRTFSLEFQVGGPAKQTTSDAPAPAPHAAAPQAVASPRLRQAEALVAAAFSFANKDGRAAQELVREVEKLLGDRLSWNVVDARRLFDVLLEHRGARRWSAEHERVFWSLAGLCLRPGFGAPGDERRSAEMVTLFGQKNAYGDRPAVAQAFAIALRRIAPGLDEDAQREVFDAVVSSLAAAKRPLAAEAEQRTLASWLERVDVERKIALGNKLVDDAVDRPASAPNVLVDLSRIGARVPAYGPSSRVVPPDVVESWLARLPLEWTRPATVTAVIRLARLVDVPTRDVSPKVRRRLAKELAGHGTSTDAIRPLTVHVPISNDERGARFGEALPPGLSLSDAEG